MARLCGVCSGLGFTIKCPRQLVCPMSTEVCVFQLLDMRSFMFPWLREFCLPNLDSICHFLREPLQSEQVVMGLAQDGVDASKYVVVGSPAER